MEITAIPIEFTLDDIYEELEEGKSIYMNHDILYYPYFIAETFIEARILTRNFKDNLCCWIDLSTGREAISSGFIKPTETIEIEEAKSIKREISSEGLRQKAKSYINFAVFHKMKVLTAPKIDIINSLEAYRPFYIVKFQMEDKRNKRRPVMVERTIMVDGISGEHHLLRV